MAREMTFPIIDHEVKHVLNFPEVVLGAGLDVLHFPAPQGSFHLQITPPETDDERRRVPTRTCSAHRAASPNGGLGVRAINVAPCGSRVMSLPKSGCSDTSASIG